MSEYADRDIEALDRAGGFYTRHVSAMTGEKLHDKSAIAAELGWRDMQLAARARREEELLREVELAKARHSDLAEQVVRPLQVRVGESRAENAHLWQNNLDQLASRERDHVKLRAAESIIATLRQELTAITEALSPVDDRGLAAHITQLRQQLADTEGAHAAAFELAAQLRQQLADLTQIPEGFVPVVGNVTERELTFALSHGEVHWTGAAYDLLLSVQHRAREHSVRSVGRRPCEVGGSVCTGQATVADGRPGAATRHCLARDRRPAPSPPASAPSSSAGSKERRGRGRGP